MKYIKRIGMASLSLGLAMPQLASASFILDTGTPTGAGAPVVLNSTQSFAAEFSLAANQTISQLSAFLTAGSDQPGAQFEFSIYSNAAGFVGVRNLPSSLYSTIATFSANGWNSAAVNWTPSAAGSYWLVVGPAGSATNPGLDLPLETSASTGTAPALGFAYASGTNAKYVASSTYPIGVEISGVSTTPLPDTRTLFLSSLLGIFGIAFLKKRTGRLPLV